MTTMSYSDSRARYAEVLDSVVNDAKRSSSRVPAASPP